MRGDFAHSAPLSYKSLISLLNEWFEKVKTGEPKDNNTALVLEADPQQVNKPKELITTGNWKPFLDY